jgi:sec-independent protein translocase protein TatA
MFEGIVSTHAFADNFGIALLVFGPRKLPELGEGIGEGIRGFKSAMKEQAEEKPSGPAATIANGQTPKKAELGPLVLPYPVPWLSDVCSSSSSLNDSPASIPRIIRRLPKTVDVGH